MNVHLLVLLVISSLLLSEVQAADWPMWRHDANRSNATTTELPTNLQLQWSRSFPRYQRAWLIENRMDFEAGYEPIAVDNTLYIGSPVNNSVMAFNINSGAERWRFYANGPIRFAPVIANGKVFIASDDGHLYCLDTTGALVWKFRAALDDRMAVGHGRLVSMWPVRGGPVVKDGIVYCAAGMWSFTGVSIYALDAETGKPVWINDSAGYAFRRQAHGVYCISGVSPQGYLAATEEYLIVPCGRSKPAVFDRKTGKLLHVEFRALKGPEKWGKVSAEFPMLWNSRVSTAGDYFYNGMAAYRLDNGMDSASFLQKYVNFQDLAVTTSDLIICSVTHKNLQVSVYAFDPENEWKSVWKKGIGKARAAVCLIRAGKHLFSGIDNAVQIFDITGEPTETANLDVNGTPTSMIAAQEKLFVMTQEGKLFCFGEGEKKPVHHELKPQMPLQATEEAAHIDSLITNAGIRDGYCIIFGPTDVSLIEVLIRRTDCKIIAVESDQTVADRMRRYFDDAGWYGERVTVIQGEPAAFRAPPYMASLVLVGAGSTIAGQKKLSRLLNMIRPYGGTACILLDIPGAKTLKEDISVAGHEDITLERKGKYIFIRRIGPLPGAGMWTHNQADAGNSRISRDTLVKPPFGVLWFGSKMEADMLFDRHVAPPRPHILGGRMLIHGLGQITAWDVYTGRFLWKAELPELKRRKLSKNYSRTTKASFVSTPEHIYVAWDKQCRLLDPATGTVTNEFHLKDNDKKLTWGEISVEGDTLIACADVVSHKIEPEFTEQDFSLAKPKDMEELKRIVFGIGKPEDASDTTTAALVQHLNRLLGAHDLLSSMPPEIKEKISDKQKKDITKQQNAVKKAVAEYKKRYKKPLNRTPYILRTNRDILGTLLPLLPSNPQLHWSGEYGWEGLYSHRLYALDCRTGTVKWEQKPQNYFLNKITIGGGRVYVEDTVSPIVIGFLKRRGRKIDDPRVIRAYDLETGKQVWERPARSEKRISQVSRIRYIQEHDILIVSSGEILRGKDGSVVPKGTWRSLQNDPASPWLRWRGGGCASSAIGNAFINTYRSGTAAYTDTTRNPNMVVNLGGFRSGCVAAIIPADGVLNAPNFAYLCGCAFPISTSLAMVHMPDMEQWGRVGKNLDVAKLSRFGLNFGAPGDRVAENGTVWLDYPVVGGTSPKLSVITDPEQLQTFFKHSLRLAGEGLRWVSASGLKGLRRLIVDMGSIAPSQYTVRLYFAEPDGLKAGKRIFNVEINGKSVLQNFDIAKEAGGPDKPIVKEFKEINIAKNLDILFSPADRTETKLPVLCGVELLRNTAEQGD